jgi:DNA-binding transcriptional LysR family regulator
MINRHKILKNLTNFYAFEAAARHQSFTKASSEIGISQSAISQKVRALEDMLGKALFARQGRRVGLTRAGEELFRDVGFAFKTIEKSVQTIHPQQHPAPIDLSISTAFAAWWMAPRLGQFQAIHPDIDLRIHTADRDVDLVVEGLSLGVRTCDGRVNGCDTALLCEEHIFPICSPSWLEQNTPPTTPADLLQHRLIHLEEPHRPTPAWKDWFAAHGLDFDEQGSGLRINDYALVLQAVLQGQGFALGWQHLVQQLLDQGLLCRPLQHSLNTGLGFYIVQPRLRPTDDPSNRVRQWMLAQARAESRG